LVSFLIAHLSIFVYVYTQLRVGAGILKFVCAELLPKWQSRPEKTPLECEADVLDGCARIMLAQSPQLLAGAYELMKDAAASLRRLSKANFSRLDPSLLETVGFWLKLYQSLHYKYLSRVSYENEKYGEATALSRKAE
jgi:hypothetical protein